MQRPLVALEDERLMVHAGLLPSWTPATALMLSREVQAKLASEDAGRFLSVLYGDEPHTWRDDLEGDDRLRAIVNVCTRLRFCTADDRMEFREKRGRAHAPEGFRPWFMHPERRSAHVLVVCGHWSTLELTLEPNVLMLDSGCLWGGPLTGMQLPGAPRVPGAVATAGIRQSRSDSAFGLRARARGGACRRAAIGGAAITSTTRRRSPHTRQNELANVSSPYAGAIEVRPGASR